jgi:hypothetical protein
MPTTDRRITLRALLCASAAVALAPCAHAAAPQFGNLFATTSLYAGNAGTVAVGQALPNSAGIAAIADGTYPTVFNNDTVDANFGITAPIQLTAFLALSLDDAGVIVGPPTGFVDVTGKTGIATSFSSKSELALNASTDGTALTFMGYHAPINALDVSNSNTAGHIDPTNTDTQPPTPRSVVEVDLGGGISATNTQSYSGNNGRAATLIRGNGKPDAYVMVGNAGNGSGIEPISIVQSTGVQAIAPHAANALATTVGVQNGVAGAKNGFEYGFAVANIGQPADKSGKDDNFRGLRVFNGNVYVSKGSGGNGVDTVYQVSVPGGAANIAGGAAQTTISILPGFPTSLASGTPTFFPFGLFFANPTTLYVADEGTQNLTADPNAGLQKWIFNGTSWNLAYVINKGLNLDQPYSVANYPASTLPATTGLRNITGNVQGNTVTIFAATATFSNLGDPGADPNAVVEVVDQLNATTAPANAAFHTIAPAIAGVVYRGLAYVPCATLATCVRNSTILATK